ncbi:MAG TPA: amino-acid N-acetyltransferase [Gemmataceae bacterium]|jgi:amino-acid N-acetyltransferase
MQRLTDLREILRYVPHFRDKVFVIALDGAVVADDNFANLLLDIAVLRSLRIGVVLAHGAGAQIERLARAVGREPSNADGTGVTDAATLELALTAANRVSHDIFAGLAGVDLRAAAGNALVAHPAGILGGVDHQFTGRVERVDVPLLQSLLDRDIVPVVPPLGFDGEGHTYRLNSDAVAAEVALALRAVKLIYLGPHAGVPSGGEVVRQVSVNEAELLLKKPAGETPAGVRSKLAQAVRAARGGVPRVHIIDGRVQEGLLAEVFSYQGIGTLVYANEYQAIRPAQKKDVRAIYGLIQHGVRNDELLQRTRAEIERQIGDFYVFEVDRSPVGCVALHFYADTQQAELACLFVGDRFENQGIGVRLAQYAETVARALGAEQLFCLSTQAFNFFVQKAGYRPGTPDDLPPSRRERYERSGRRSQVLVKLLDASVPAGPAPPMNTA